MKVISLDFETSIGKTIHGPTFRDLNNDVYTQIWATHPEHVYINHSLTGYKRTLDERIDLTEVDVIVGHNISFDLCYIWQDTKIKEFILGGGAIWDTMQAEYHLTGQDSSFASLASLQEKYLGQRIKPSRIGFLYKKGIGADKILAKQEKCPRLFRLYEKYCKSDGATPLLIFKAQYKIAKEKGMLSLVQMYNDYLLSIINMTCTGIPIDVIKTEKTLNEFNLNHLEFLEKAQHMLKFAWTDKRLPTFNINSPDHKSAVLFGGVVKATVRELIGSYKNGNPRHKNIEQFVTIKGFALDKSLTHSMKKEGLYCTDDKVMKRIETYTTNSKVKEYCFLQKQAMTYKKAAKTYCQAFLDRNVNGLIYPNFNTTITPTGRLSSSEPNMQNIPSKSPLGKQLMSLLIAPPGWKCVSIDFSQLEKWTQAWVSGDEALKAELLKGTCLHCKTLAAKEGLEYNWVYQKAKVEQDPEWDKKRTAIKPVGFLMDYGGMEKRVAEETGLSLGEVEDIFRIDRELYPQKYTFFEKTLPGIVNATSKYMKELLPIFGSKGNIVYNETLTRKIGYWKTEYGKLYSFKDSGRYTKKGIKRGFSMPQFKNYPNQGGGGDVQAATSAELLKLLISKSDCVKMINEIHDSKMFLVRTDVLEPVLKHLKETIENVTKIFMRRFGVVVPFKFPVSIDVGNNFGNMKEYKLGESSNDRTNCNSK